MRVSDVSRSNTFRVLFLGALAVSLGYGLQWATDVEQLRDALPRHVREGESRVVTPSEEPAAVAAGPARPPPPPAPSAATPSATRSEARSSASILITAARAPQQTTIQVLDAGGGLRRTNEAAAALEELGYDVISVSGGRVTVGITTIWYTEGNQTEAHALRARDERFAVVAKNQGLSAGVDLHVLVAEDWP